MELTVPASQGQPETPSALALCRSQLPPSQWLASPPNAAIRDVPGELTVSHGGSTDTVNASRCYRAELVFVFLFLL